MIFKNLPALVTLAASFIASIVTIIYRYDVTKSLVIILAVTICFYIVGVSIRALFNKFLVVEEPEEEEESGEGEENTEEIESDETM